MSEKRPAESSTEEPVSKKQAITTEMYEKLEAENAELKKRNIDAQEMTQKQIESFQERTAVSEEKFEKVKKLISRLNKHRKVLETWASFQKLLSTVLEKKFPASSASAASTLKNEFENRQTIVVGYCKLVQEEINQLMD